MPRLQLPYIVGAILLLYVPRASARVNTTSAVDVFWISDCALCTSGQKDSVFCTSADSDDNYVSNETMSVTIKIKKAALGPSDGGKFCWSGEAPSTFS